MTPRQLVLCARESAQALVALLLPLLCACGGTSTSPPPPPPTAPVAPTGLVATGHAARIDLTWTASANATSYVIRRAPTAGGAYSDKGTATATTFADSGLFADSTFYYVVRAVNASGQSGDSNEASATTSPLPPPETPTGLTALGGVGQVTLTWAASPTATGYGLSSGSAAAGPFTLLASPGTTTFVDTGLDAGTTRFYVVHATLGTLESPDSAVASATTAPPAPTSVSAARGNTLIVLTWTAAPGAASYVVLSSLTAGGPYTEAGSTVATELTLTGLANKTTVFLRVRAVNTAGSADSAEVSATPDAVPDTPVGLTATPGDAQVTLSWTEVAGADGYELRRSTVEGTAATSGELFTSLHSPFVDSGPSSQPVNGTTYYYALTAYNSVGSSMSTDEVAATPQVTLVPPSEFEAVPRSNAVYLHWRPALSATGARVLRRTGVETFSSLGTTTTADFLDATALNGTTYTYVLHSLRAAEETGDSMEVTATPARELCMGSTDLGTVLAVDADATGGTSVRRTFGTMSRMGNTAGVAVLGTTGEIAVANRDARSLTVYPRAASGEVPPSRVLAGETSGFDASTPYEGLVSALAYSTAREELFVAQYGVGIRVHARAAQAGDAPLRTLTTVQNPVAVATDASRLWVIDTNHLYAFPLTAKDTDAPTQTITSADLYSANSLLQLLAVAVGPDRVYVANSNHVHSLELTANGALQTTAYRSVETSAANPPETIVSLAFDAARSRLLVQGIATSPPFWVGVVASLPASYATGASPTVLLSNRNNGIMYATGIAVDPGHNELFVSAMDLLVFDLADTPTSRLPARTIKGLSENRFGPSTLNVDWLHTELFSCTRTNEHCDVYPLGTRRFATSPLRSIYVGDNSGTGSLVIDEARGELYFADQGRAPWGAVTIFDRLAEGNATVAATPLRVLGSLSQPFGSFFDATRDELWVAQADDTDPAVHVYARGQTGTLTLVRTLAGAQTGLVLPNAVWAGADDVAVLDDSCTLRVYPRALGNVAPTLTMPPSDPNATGCVGLTGDATSWYVATSIPGGTARIDVHARSDGALLRSLKPFGGGSSFQSLAFCSD